MTIDVVVIKLPQMELVKGQATLWQLDQQELKRWKAFRLKKPSTFINTINVKQNCNIKICKCYVQNV